MTPRKASPAPKYDPNRIPHPWRDCDECGWRHYRDMTITVYLPFPQSCTRCGHALDTESDARQAG
jgi:hypothetical protein